MASKQSKTKPKKKVIKQKKPSLPFHDRIQAANTFIDKRKTWVIAFLFILSAGLSLVYYLQARDSAIMSIHKWVNSDMAFFDTWAKHIVAGDFWGDEALHPFHDWHDSFAAEYFRQYPDEAITYNYTPADSAQSLAAKKSLINDIYKGKTFHQEPLYAYMLAATYSIFGFEQKWIYFLQFFFAALTSVLVFLAARKLFGSLAGLVAALFVTLCGSIMVYEMVLLRTTLTNFFTVLLLYLFLLVMEKPDWKRSAAFGAASGFALLTQSYFILFLFPAWVWLLWVKRKQLKEILPPALAYIAAFLVVMSPLFYRNIRVGLPMTAMASHGAMAYIPMNTQQSGPMESFYVHMPTLVRIRHESGGRMIPAVFASLGTFDSFSNFWKIYKQKLDGMFMWREIPNNMSFYTYREMAPILKSLPVRYFFIAPLGLVGFLFGWWRYRSRFVPFVLMTIASMIPLLIAGNLARYRTPLVIMMCLLAAYFIIEMVNLIQQKKWKATGIGLGLTAAAFLYTSTIVSKNEFIFYGNDFHVIFEEHYLDKLLKYEAESNYAEYHKLTSQMVEELPDYFLKVKADKKIVKSNEAESTRYAANYMESHMNILKFLNKTEEAAFYEERINILRSRVEDYNRRRGMQ